MWKLGLSSKQGTHMHISKEAFQSLISSQILYSRIHITFCSLPLSESHKLRKSASPSPLYSFEVRQHWIMSYIVLNLSVHNFPVLNCFLVILGHFLYSAYNPSRRQNTILLPQTSFTQTLPFIGNLQDIRR